MYIFNCIVYIAFIVLHLYLHWSTGVASWVKFFDGCIAGVGLSPNVSWGTSDYRCITIRGGNFLGILARVSEKTMENSELIGGQARPRILPSTRFEHSTAQPLVGLKFLESAVISIFFFHLNPNTLVLAWKLVAL